MGLYKQKILILSIVYNRPRPATSATLAKRLVSTALGIKNTVSPEQRKMERQMLADAKGKKKKSRTSTQFLLSRYSLFSFDLLTAKKRMVAQQKEAAWEGTLT